MGYSFNDGSEPPPEITQEMAVEFLQKIFSNIPQAPVPISATAQHIGGYIEDLMFSQGYSSLDISIRKDSDDQLVFTINKTEL